MFVELFFFPLRIIIKAFLNGKKSLVTNLVDIKKFWQYLLLVILGHFDKLGKDTKLVFIRVVYKGAAFTVNTCIQSVFMLAQTLA